MDLGLKDKRALVIGSSRGLGYVTALTLAREGCMVAVNSRDGDKVKAAAQKIAAETGARVIGLAGDVSDTTTAHDLVGSYPDHQRGRAPGGFIRDI
jgi:3-oxoacyl-[acyl-carrier protein] reductase